MGSSKITEFTEFLSEVPEEYRDFVSKTDNFLTAGGYKQKIEKKTSGASASYIHPGTKRLFLQFYFRNKALYMDLYTVVFNDYVDFLDRLPQCIAEEINKFSNCRKMINPDDCNPLCGMGYDFEIKGTRYQKCGYNRVRIPVNPESMGILSVFSAKKGKSAAIIADDKKVKKTKEKISDVKNDSPHQTQMKQRPKITDMIEALPEDEKKQAILAFVEYCAANRMTVQWGATNAWYIGRKGKRAGRISIGGNAALQDYSWYVTIADLNVFDPIHINFIENENLTELIWKNVKYCEGCLKTCAPGTDRKILGKMFSNVCVGAIRFKNPDTETLNGIKKILEFTG